MKRSQVLLSILGAILVVALFYMFVYSPAQDELAELETQIAAELTAQTELTAEIAHLRTVRDTAPEIEAHIAAAAAIVPTDAALPSALRQLQLAADEAGMLLTSVSTSRPVAVEGSTTGLASIGVNVVMSGSYFQVVDFLRRIEDPTITPRGLDWNNVTISRETHPTLSVSLTGELYAVFPVPPAAVEPEEPVGDGTEVAPEGDADDQADEQTEDVT